MCVFGIVHPHQRCGYSDSPLARIYFFYTAGSRNRFEGMEAVCPHTKKHKTISKRQFFLIEKYIEDARQEGKHVPDLLEAIIQPPGLVKEELWPICLKCVKLDPKSQNSRFQLFGSGSPKFSRRRPTPASSPVGFEHPRPFPCNIWPR